MADARNAAPKPGFFRLLGPGNLGFAAFAIAVLVAFLCLARRMGNEEERYVSVALILTANFLGIPIGLLLTPKNPTERQVFSSLGRALAVFGSGWLLAKIDGLTTSILTYDNLTPLIEFRLAGSVCCFVVATSAVYVMRTYAVWTAINKRIAGRVNETD